MPDHVGEGVRIATPTAVSEESSVPRTLVPAAMRILIVIAGAFILLAIATLVLPVFIEDRDRYVALVLLAIFAIGAYTIAYVTVRPLHTLLDWVRGARQGEWERVDPLPIVGNDEMGVLAQEVLSAISTIRELRTHERELLTHKSDTITLIEHQLRTALTSLKWTIEASPVPDEVKAAVERVSATVQEIINAARIGEGKFDYVFADTDIASLMESMVSRFQTRAHERGVTLTSECSGTIPHVRADAERLGVAVHNILSNAVEYTPQGGAVAVSVAPVEGGLVDVTVKDTGVGMSQEDLANLFTKMHRGRNAMKMRPDGSGLGLYVTRNILNEHRAEIMIQSKEGHGTQVSFRIPVVAR